MPSRGRFSTPFLVRYLLHRLRTRMVLAQNSEQSLVKKQDHRELPQIHVGETVY